MTAKPATEHHLEPPAQKEAAEARPSLHMSKCHTVGNLTHRLISICLGTEAHS